MIADTREELVHMALKVGLDASYIQEADSPTEHVCLSPDRRAVALTMGATELYGRQFMQMIIRRRAEVSADHHELEIG